MFSYDQLLRMAQIGLIDGQKVTRERIEQVVDSFASSQPGFDQREQMIRDLEAVFAVTQADGTMLAEDTGHVPWLDGRRASIDWDFWRRYRGWLTDVKGWSPVVVNKLDTLTDQVLDRIEEPSRGEAWDRRGLVVGQVQSGKTSHYTGLICKAVDAGYKFIVVLAGVHNSLRSQTQLRLDEGFLGVDTKQERAWKKNTNKIGAGLVSSKQLHVAYLTNSEDNGDFKRGIAKQIGIPLGSPIPILLVIKKNSSVLKNLIVWLETQASTTNQDGRPFFTDFPLLLLDDEADHASINTKETILDHATRAPKEEQEATAINKRIRELLKMFARSVYVGYTATPFANVFIHPDVNTTSAGRDLFPRHFILNLPAPSNYIGPVQVFGLGEEYDGLLERTGLPIRRTFDDHIHEFPPRHDKAHVPDALPASLKEAIKVFVLVCAARILRGQESEHNSMLVHVTRFVAVQARVSDLIELELVSLRNRILYGDGDRPDSVVKELADLWNSDVNPTTREVQALLDDPKIKPADWRDVEPHLKLAVSRIKVKTINGTAQDVLDYFDSPSGISVIAVGGDKLSRGLTLEGLSVSYYLRASRMYDTLMQMGRWFGYRPGYADLCRLYTTDELVSWYRHITIASEELRQDFDEMVRAGRTPEDFGLKVLAHPGGLVVTGAGKLRNYTQMRVSFSEKLIESYRISCRRSDQQANFLSLTRLIAVLGNPNDRSGNHYIWRAGGNHLLVTSFLRELVGYPGSMPFAPDRLATFIENLTQDGELTDWTIALINIKASNQKGSIASLEVGFSERNLGRPESEILEVGQRHIISMEHEWIDMSEAESEIARIRWKEENPGKDLPDSLTGKWARKVRPSSRGLLLLYLLDPTREGLPDGQKDIPYLGYALSFPASTNGAQRAVSYVVNNIYAREEFED